VGVNQSIITWLPETSEVGVATGDGTVEQRIDTGVLPTE
jgi:hypothetical protein